VLAAPSTAMQVDTAKPKGKEGAHGPPKPKEKLVKKKSETEDEQAGVEAAREAEESERRRSRSPKRRWASDAARGRRSLSLAGTEVNAGGRNCLLYAVAQAICAIAERRSRTHKDTRAKCCRLRTFKKRGRI
jgi:hypothetical protein